VAKPICIRSTLASRQHRPFSRSLLPMGAFALMAMGLLLLVACDQGSDAPTITTAATVSPIATSAPSSPSPTTSVLVTAITTTVPAAPVAGSTAMLPVTFTAGATNTTTPTLVPPATATSPVLATGSPTPVLVQSSATQTSGSGANHRYVFPVIPAWVTTYGQYHHDYPATDIFCPIGSLFVAPTDGVVDFVSIKDSWDPSVDDPATRGGLSVAIIGADGVRYYGSHLSAIEPGIMPGVQVAAGQILGKTGKSGDARFVDPHLHFGISPPTTPADWEMRRGIISPYKYLRAWEAGTQLQPVLP
jgi:peptidoglycan LD-endopeptidase LytH